MFSSIFIFTIKNADALSIWHTPSGRGDPPGAAEAGIHKRHQFLGFFGPNLGNPLIRGSELHIASDCVNNANW